MKIKVLASIFCICLTFSAVTGCGLKMPDDSASSPSDVATNSPTNGDNTKATTIMGVVGAIDNGTITIHVVKQADESSSGKTIIVGATMYIMTGSTYSIAPGANTTVIFENQGYAIGSLSDIVMGDFLAVALQGDTVMTIIDGGPSDASNTDTTDDINGEQPSVKPTDNGSTPSVGVPDSTETLTYTIITDNLKVRSGPDTTNSILGVLDTGSRETGTVTDGWLKFTYNGKTAYCSAEYLAVSTAPEGVPDSSTSKSYVTADNLLARSGPGTTYASLGTLTKGTKVTGTVADGWLKFTYNDKTAYCSASYLAAE